MLRIEEINGDLRLGLLDLEAFNKKEQIELKRDLEKKGIAFLLEKMLGNNVKLAYTPEKKPYLQGQKTHVSISHSHNMLAILCSEAHSTGIDIELVREKVLQIKHKFLSKEEETFAGNNVEKLITIWAAKEAIYKAYGKKQVEFIENIFVEPFAEEETFFGRMDLPHFKQRYLLCRRKIDNYVLVYILSEV